MILRIGIVLMFASVFAVNSWAGDAAMTTGATGGNPVDKLTLVVSLLIALSIASERLVEIFKNIVPWLSNENPNPTHEGWRKAALQGLAVGAGILTAFLANPAVSSMDIGLPNSLAVTFALGLLASGGSGFWNTVLKYLLAVKDAQQVDTTNKKDALRSRKLGL